MFAVVEAFPSILVTIHVYGPSLSIVTGLMCKVLFPLTRTAFGIYCLPFKFQEYCNAGSPSAVQLSLYEVLFSTPSLFSCFNIRGFTEKIDSIGSGEIDGYDNDR